MLDKKVKMLLLVVNKLGVEINYEVITRYSEKFDSVVSEYHLKTWHKRKVKDKNTGKEKDQWYCKDMEFKRIDQVAKYLLAIKESKEHKNE